MPDGNGRPGWLCDGIDPEDRELDLNAVVDRSRGILVLDGELNYQVSGAVEYDGVCYISDSVSARIFTYTSFGRRLRGHAIRCLDALATKVGDGCGLVEKTAD